MMRSSSGSCGSAEEEIREPHERGVHAAARGARHRADDHADDDRDQHRGEPDRDRDAAAVEHARKEVLPQIVGAEGVLAAKGPARRALKSISLIGTGQSHGLDEDGQ